MAQQKWRKPMIRKAISSILIITGLLMTLTGLGALMPAEQAYAQAVPQPTPRPALNPEDDGDDTAQPVADMAHITGTVIDQASSAPVPGISVRVGNSVVATDGNGNYDLYIEPGNYTVSAIGSDNTPQPAAEVVLIAGEMVVQHLIYIAPVLIATATPVIVAPAAVAEPIAEPVARTVAIRTEGAMPDRLPATAGNPLFLVGAWFWLSLGVALMIAGMVIARRTDALYAPARMLARYAMQPQTSTSNADAAAFLAALLTSDTRAGRPTEDPLLRALLDRDARRRSDAKDLLADLLLQPAAA
jgi:hypothetical protein